MKTPKYPIYIISKGRWDTRLTSKALEAMRTPYRIVIEPQEYDKYAQFIRPDKILTLPFSNLGQGSIPARNWVWEHSISEGHEKHWILDDNIRSFRRLYQSRRYPVVDSATFIACELFTDRFENVALSGMNYTMFGVNSTTSGVKKPFLQNTRIYSCILIRNDIPYRWRGRYNEDTDLSLRALKDKWCTILFNAFLCEKTATMTMRGGNTDVLYRQDGEFDGRLEMARSLQAQHPDCVKITRKWGRWQHNVDYKRFRGNRLILRRDIILNDETDEMGMRLIKKEDSHAVVQSGKK